MTTLRAYYLHIFVYHIHTIVQSIYTLKDETEEWVFNDL